MVDSKEIGAFEIDSKIKNGRLALIYKNGKVAKPQIWFQDLSCKWYFIANTFTDYFRLMIMHLGLPNWHYAFTEVGLDPQTLQWFRFLSPERLAIDIENRKNFESGKKRSHDDINSAQNKLLNDKIKVEGLKRKKRRLRLKSKGNNDAVIEKFTAQSSKQAKYAKTTVKKKDASDIRSLDARLTVGSPGMHGFNH